MSRAFALAAMLAVAAPATARESALAPLRLTPSDIAGRQSGAGGPGTSGVAGIRTVVLVGDPTKVGPYAIELSVPAHTTIAAHSHRDDRTAVVVSGTWHFGYGAVAQSAATKALDPGSFYSEPAGAAHFAMTGAAPVTVIITGFGPTDTHYVASNTTEPSQGEKP